MGCAARERLALAKELLCQKLRLAGFHTGLCRSRSSGVLSGPVWLGAKNLWRNFASKSSAPAKVRGDIPDSHAVPFREPGS